MKNAESSPQKNYPLLSLGFLRQNLRKKLQKLGYSLSPPWAKNINSVCVWGMRTPSIRGVRYSQKHNLPLYYLEDGFIRSVQSGWREAPLSLRIDNGAAYFDAARKADFFRLLGDRELTDEQVENYITWQIQYGISKYNTQSRGLWTEKNYVLIIDQKRDDASIRYGGAEAADFALMLETAQKAFPHNQIVIKSHPVGEGYFDESMENEQIKILKETVNIWDLLLGAKAVFAVTSQMGFEAILAGHEPWVFGQPFYSGLGLTKDQKPITPQKNCSRYDLYEAFMLRSTFWFNNAEEPASLDETLMAIEVRRRAFELENAELQFLGLSSWKIPYFRKIFRNQGQGQPVRWGEKLQEHEWIVEDGFLRSQGLGAKLNPPLSLVIDKTGIYFDPRQPSDLENLILSRKTLRPFEADRIQKLLHRIRTHHLSKYNLGEVEPPEHIPQKSLLVIGQVEDDRSVKCAATGEVKSNADLLKAARRDFPDHYIIYKPHPDVQAGLRTGQFDASAIADWVFEGENIASLWAGVERVACLSSLAGFEALIRGKPVTCYGAPFYAGWGLTDDRAPTPSRRCSVNFESLAYATLVDYPLYFDPKLQCQTTPEIAIRRLSEEHFTQPILLKILTSFQQKYYKFLRFRENKTSSTRK